MVVKRYHRGGSMVVKKGVDGSVVEGVLQQNQGVTRVTPEEPMNIREREGSKMGIREEREMEDLYWGHIGSPSKMKRELPEGWRPPRDLNPFEERRLADMRLWAKAHGVEMADWNAFFEIWLTKTPPKGQGNGKSGSVLAAADRLIERLEREGATDYVPGTSGPQPLSLDQRPRSNGLRKLPPR
jgi:hypothetical protein